MILFTALFSVALFVQTLNLFLFPVNTVSVLPVAVVVVKQKKAILRCQAPS